MFIPKPTPPPALDEAAVNRYRAMAYDTDAIAAAAAKEICEAFFVRSRDQALAHLAEGDSLSLFSNINASKEIGIVTFISPPGTGGGALLAAGIAYLMKNHDEFTAMLMKAGMKSVEVGMSQPIYKPKSR